jgi:hypothetical protein
MERTEVLALLSNSVCNVVFNKVTGERRDMRCTLKEDLIPDSKDQGTTNNLNTGRVRDVNPSVVVVYDLEKSDWRSFRIENLISIDPVP